MRHGLPSRSFENIAPCTFLIRGAHIPHGSFLSASVKLMGGMLNILLYLLLDT